MKSFVWILLSLVVLFLLAGQGYAFVNTISCGGSEEQVSHNCCSKEHNQKSGKQNTGDICYKSSDCQMNEGPLDLIGTEQTSLFGEEQIHYLKDTELTNVLTLQISKEQPLIWLYQVYYPDKSSLYLEKNRLLL